MLFMGRGGGYNFFENKKHMLVKINYSSSWKVKYDANTINLMFYFDETNAVTESRKSMHQGTALITPQRLQV